MVKFKFSGQLFDIWPADFTQQSPSLTKYKISSDRPAALHSPGNSDQTVTYQPADIPKVIGPPRI